MGLCHTTGCTSSGITRLARVSKIPLSARSNGDTGTLFWQYLVTVAGLALQAGCACPACWDGCICVLPPYSAVGGPQVSAGWSTLYGRVKGTGGRWRSPCSGLPVSIIACTLFPAWCEAVPAAFTALGPILGFPSSVLQQCELKQVCSGIFLVPSSR